MICSPAARSYHALLRMPWWPGMRAGEDRRVVRERDRRQRRHRAVPERDAHLDEARDVRCFAARGHVVEHVGVGAVEQEADDVTAGRSIGSSRSSSARAVLDRRGSGRRARGAQPSSAAIVGATSTSRAARGMSAELAHALAADHERRARLHDAERAVLAEVAALVLPVVRGRVEHAEVGRGRRVEELGDLVVGVRVGVVGPVRVGVGLLVGERRRTCRSTGRRAGRCPRSSTTSRSRRRRSGGSVTRPSCGERLVASSRRVSTMSTIGLERRIEQHLERGSAAARCSSAIWWPALTARRGRRCGRLSGHGRSVRPGCRTGARAPLSCLVRPAALAAGRRVPTSLDHADRLERSFRAHVHAPSPPTSPGSGTSSTPRARSSAGSPPRSRRCCAASTSRSGRRTSTPATTSIVVNASKLAISPRKGDRQAVPPPHRLPGRHPHREPRAPARPRPRAGRAARGAAHAAEGPARPRRC